MTHHVAHNSTDEEWCGSTWLHSSGVLVLSAHVPADRSVLVCPHPGPPAIRCVPRWQEGHLVVDGPNSTYAEFAIHEWQRRVHAVVGPALVQAQAAFPTLAAQHAVDSAAAAAAADVDGGEEDAPPPAAAAAAAAAVITLVGSCGRAVTIPARAARLCLQIRPILRGCTEPIRLPGISAQTLEKVRDYCVHKAGDVAVGQGPIGLLNPDDRHAPIVGWDAEFVVMAQGALFEAILAANCLNVVGMLDLCCKAVAEMIRGKSPGEIRQHFNIVNNFTPQEEEQIRRENEWLEEA